jgi:hypothetical protein
MVQRVLERRAYRRARIEEGTTATVAIMLRLLPPPKALLVIHDPLLRRETERRITPDMLEVDVAEGAPGALRRVAAELRQVIITDDLELIRTWRARKDVRTPFIVFIAELDESAGRRGGPDRRSGRGDRAPSE